MPVKVTNSRYDKMLYNRCGRSGLKLPAISLGLWFNFGDVDQFENSRKLAIKAFDLGITHFDLANNYGPPPGSAEENFGRILKKDLSQYRDELVISTKAGYCMWAGPYGEWGSRKYLIASLDQSLNRMGLDYVDIFYHHRPDPDTSLEETMAALDHIVHQGKALYVGISNYNSEQTQQAAKILDDLGTPCLIHQARYNMFDRRIEDNLLKTLNELGIGCTVFSPLDQGILSDKYIDRIPEDSRAAKDYSFLEREQVTKEKVTKVKKLKAIAQKRGQSISQMAIAWILRHKTINSVIIGASKESQIEENVAALENISFSEKELKSIEDILNLD